MKLAQAVSDQAMVGLVENTPKETAVAIAGTSASLLSLFLFPVFGIVLFVFWIIAFIQVISRQDLKQSKALWIVLLLLVGFIGMPTYFFVEGKKSLGWATIILYMIMLLLPVFSFILK